MRLISSLTALILLCITFVFGVGNIQTTQAVGNGFIHPYVDSYQSVRAGVYTDNAILRNQQSFIRVRGRMTEPNQTITIKVVGVQQVYNNAWFDWNQGSCSTALTTVTCRVISPTSYYITVQTFNGAIPSDRVSVQTKYGNTTHYKSLNVR